MGAVYVFLMPLIYFLAPDAHQTALPERVIAWVVWAMMLVAVLPQYYEVREDGLFLRLRWKARLIPHASLAEIRDPPNRSSLRAFRVEVNLVRLITNAGETHIFGVEEKQRFLSELAKHSPQVARRGRV